MMRNLFVVFLLLFVHLALTRRYAPKQSSASKFFDPKEIPEYFYHKAYSPCASFPCKFYNQKVEKNEEDIEFQRNRALLSHERPPSARYSQLEGGMSIGTWNLDITGRGRLEGTLGLVLWRKSTGEKVCLTAGHNVFDPPAIVDGEVIVQPGLDPPRKEDEIGTVLASRVDPYVDCSLISTRGRNARVKRIMNVGTVHSDIPQKNISRGLVVQKMGISSFLTIGEIVEVDHSGFSETGPFVNHILVKSRENEPFSQFGDSGAIVYHIDSDDSIKVVGMIRSGSGQLSVVTPWQAIEQYCDVSLEQTQVRVTVDPLAQQDSN